MLKVRLVALGTIVAILGLVFALVSFSRHRDRKISNEAITVPSASAEPQLAASAPAPNPSAGTTLLAPTSPNGVRDYAILPDGRPVPELPSTAPKSCGFGAILITFEGVQAAPRHPRSKAEAFELAKTLLPEAELDFASTAKKGDPGSLADAGTISRGILERSVEYQLFTLEKGKLYPEPIETPRGYWILRRTR